MKYIIRELRHDEIKLLEDFLYEAIYIPKGYTKEIPRSIIYQPELWRTIDKFSGMKDDHCLVAEVNGKVVGAVWVRTVEQYGFISNDIPSFAISLYREYRHHGIGTALMKNMLAYLKDNGYKKASLSVQKENYAVNMYKAVGFKIIGENEEEFIMTCDLS